MKDIETFIHSNFTSAPLEDSSHTVYIPRAPERQEYRKYGIKTECLSLYIEEVLYEYIRTFGSTRAPVQTDTDSLLQAMAGDRPPAPSDSQEEACARAAEYASKRNCTHFPAYREIRSTGYVLLPKYRPGSRPVYSIYRPDKHFNRKTSTAIGIFAVVSPEEHVSRVVDELPRTKTIVGIQDKTHTVLLELQKFHDEASLFTDADIIRKY